MMFVAYWHRLRLQLQVRLAIESVLIDIKRNQRVYLNTISAQLTGNNLSEQNHPLNVATYFEAQLYAINQNPTISLHASTHFNVKP
ncbi:unnamed protein product [Phytophthora fragariaefolia]|uniref:Unnamed protein product n=1 Tax=Phytophthora fragariaefolia TaxID=1490495 RepID=A0A9W7D4E1_9STRA|nr:unnamed protein product [Phytophthora fragariaefolia]